MRFDQWQNGWCQAAEKCVSPNHGARPAQAQIDLIVVHSISLPPGEYGTQAVQQLFTNQLDWDAHPYFQSIRGLEVSAHFFIERQGKVWQFVSCDDRAWHAGASHYRGRGNCNDDSIGIELEGLEGETFEAAQYDSLTQLCQALKQQYPSRIWLVTNTSRRVAKKIQDLDLIGHCCKKMSRGRLSTFPSFENIFKFLKPFGVPLRHFFLHLKRACLSLTEAGELLNA